MRLGDELRNCLVNETPTLVTEETASTARIYRAMDIESGALGIIIGGRKFRVTGRNVYVSREGESLKLQDGKGRLFDIAYDKIESPQRVEGHLVEPPIESGTCKLILTTYGGDESEDAKLGIYERIVSFVKFDEPKKVASFGEVACDTSGNVSFDGGQNLDALATFEDQEDRSKFEVKAKVNDGEPFDVMFLADPAGTSGSGSLNYTGELHAGDTVTIVGTINPSRTDVEQGEVTASMTVAE